MRIANRRGRLVLVDGDRCLDVAEASDGRFPADPALVFPRWAEFRAWAGALAPWAGELFARRELGPPSPRPAQAFGIGTNYRQHLDEMGWAAPEVPLVFAKFASSLQGPEGTIELSGDHVDWEVELVVVIGTGGRDIRSADAWEHVAGVTLGQDVSDRVTQRLPAANPQFGLGKSYAGYGPTGPVLVTPDELGDPDDIEISCRLGDEEVQRGRTSQLIYPVTALVEYLSGIVELLPGDLIFTGTPQGVGLTRTPPRFLADGDVLTSSAPEIGEMRHVATAGRRSV